MVTARSFDASPLRAFLPARRYLIGISGGRDSVALLHWLVTLGYSNLVLAHFDHQLRGRSSSADARFVKRLAATLDLPFELGAADVRQLATTGKQSIETAARHARYSFFAAVARRRRCRTIFLGHHADDLVETFLLNLFRGSGTTGLASIRPVAERAIAGTQLKLVRPLLGVWRKDIDAYVHKHRLEFREDLTNRCLEPLRNRVRHRVIPYLERTFGRKLRQNIWRTATIAAEEEIFFTTLLPKDFVTAGELGLKPLREMSIAVQRRILHQWLRTAKIADVGFDAIERVRELLDPVARVAKTNLPGARHVRRRAGKIFIE